ncbi:hypothetical protein [Streptomyces hygroscopicus]|uniref:hypothetical protein n=1 Tax=Streptomyces hygroscopicus TaxID=1912 RepID=UPI001FCAE2B8|nr:hypothetical protein [Streptomyces hygroscopicus]BDH10274.1 hypothetical protein HOK021_14530 [Streptomyces hygroscopicus]
MALSEPRVVPMRMWAELAAALSGEPVAEHSLTLVLVEFSAELASDERGVLGCDGLAEARWQGLPAFAAPDSNSSEGTTTSWDPTTGRLLAGPWHGEEIPEEHHADLAWPPGTEGDSPGPTTFDELFEAMPDEPDVHPLLLASPALPMGDVTILAGSGGLFAVENFLTMVALWITGLRLTSVIDDTDEVFMLRQHVQAAQGEIDEVGAAAAAWSYVFYNE